LIDPNATATRGGSVYSGQSQLEFTYCHFTGNTAEAGSAVYSYQSNVSYDHCLIANNNQGRSGTIASWSDSTITLSNCQLLDNIYGSVYIWISENSCVKNNLFIQQIGSSNDNLIWFNSRFNSIENNTFYSSISTRIFGRYGDSMVIRNNAFIWAKSVPMGIEPAFNLVYDNYFNSSNYNLVVENNTFLTPSHVGTNPAIRWRVPVGDNPILRNNIFFTEPNKRSLTIYEGPLGGVWLPSASDGHNIFSDNNFHAGTNDLTLIDSVQLALEPLGYYGGTTPTRIPKLNSVALNSGNPNNFNSAQNGPIYGIRDRGAAERPVIINDTVSACFGPVTWWGNTFTSPGVYRDTAANANSLDSTGVLVLTGLEASLTNTGGLLTASANESATFTWINCATNQVVDTGVTFLPAANGSYAAVATAGSCLDTTECVAYNEVGLSELLESRVVIYPNPTSGLLSLAVQGPAVPTHYAVLDLQGRVLRHTSFQGSTLHLFGLPSGTYLVQVAFDNGTQVVKRVVLAF
jgi:hypothetical protein